MKLKLDYKRTILVGFAFFLINAFWQAYDNAIPLTLTNKFGMSQTGSGVIMALDNILAVVLLPLFGALSDRCTSKRGRRTPFILVGTVLAAIMLVFLSFADNTQLGNIEAVEDHNPQSLAVIYDSEQNKTLKTPEGAEFMLTDGTAPADVKPIARDEFTAIEMEITNADGETETNPAYTAYVVPARQSYAATVTDAHPAPLTWFVVLLLCVLLAMAIFRSPAVALMPDVTLKPLRSKGNAVINLMGTAGGILVLVLGKFAFDTSAAKNSLMSYTGFFSVVVIIMLLALTVFLTKVKEPEWAAEMQKESSRLGLEDEAEDKKKKKENTRKLSRSELGSLLLILLSVCLWYMGYNAVTSKYSVYSSNVLHKDYNLTLLIAQGAAIISYLPVGIISSRLGRKKTVLAGVVMLGTAFAAASFMRANSPDAVMYILFALAGIGWATINVNSFPMVVELCTGGNVGRYTGFYYTASMLGQAITPWIAGWFMDTIATTALFPYATVFTALAFVTMFFVRHGDGKSEPKKGLEALDVD